jgi:hypothetical protein
MKKGALYYSIETKNLYQSNFIMCYFYFIFTWKDKIKFKWMTWKINKPSYISLSMKGWYLEWNIQDIINKDQSIKSYHMTLENDMKTL